MARKIAAPRGTRDLYPEDVLKRRYITQAWRDVSIRHGFEEIEGPTFEQSELYAVKSGEGILGELFQAFSGKSPEEIEEVRRTGRAPFALRPEFTPTLARMYAAKAASLSSPTKWFTAGPYFRAERPQRGRLREFLQWNCDIMGGETDADLLDHDAELMACIVSLLELLGFSHDDARVHVNNRQILGEILSQDLGVPASKLSAAFGILDKYEVDKSEASIAYAISLGIVENAETPFARFLRKPPGSMSLHGKLDLPGMNFFLRFSSLQRPTELRRLAGWCEVDIKIARGLAYYTGTVFEVIAGRERAVVGGGRYDDLISLFGGPATPAVGFGMGDVVLSLLLEDKGLMPEEAELMDAVSRPPASVRPDAFVVAEDEALDAVVTRAVARLRAGVESEAWRERGGRPWAADRYEVRPLHARRSYKATRKRDKLVKEALKQQARAVVVVESEESCTVRDLGSGREERVGLDGLGAALTPG